MKRFTQVLVLSSLFMSSLTQDCTNPILEDESGTITSPGYPKKNYKNRLECTWTIKVHEDFRINLTFTDFQLEKSNENCHDYLEMWDGGDETAPFVSRLCEESLEDLESTTYISSGNMFFLKLTTDSTGRYKGFSADYFSIPAFATTTQWRTNTAAVTTSDVVATSSLPSTQQVILTSVPKTDKTNDSRTDIEASSLPPFETVSLASVTFHLPPPGDLNLVIVLVPIGLLILLGLLCFLIYCMNEAKNRKLPKTSEEVGPNGGDVNLHVHHNDCYATSDGYTALQISKKLTLTTDATAVSIDKVTEDESMSRNEFKIPDMIEKMGDDGGNFFNVAYESYDDSGGRRGKEEPGDGVHGNDSRSNAVYENYK